MLPLLLLSLAAAPAPTAPASPAPAAGARAAAKVEARPAFARGDEARVRAELAGLAPAALAVHTLAANDVAPLAVGVWPAQPYQGALLVVDVAAPAEITSATGTFLGRKLIWHRLDDRTWRGMGPVADDAKTGAATLRVEVRTAQGRFTREAKLEVLPLAFDTDELRVDSKFTRLSAAAQKQVAADRAAMAAMWKKGSTAAPPRARFLLPREDRTTAPYGTRRTYNGVTKSVHQGWDIDGEVGEEIRAPAAGIVTMVRDQYYSGGTLFVDHGGGLYTGYFHMDSFAVQEGDRVEAGRLLGTVGKSGRVTGPHLHWAAKIGGRYIHPASLLLFDFATPMVRPPGEAVAAPGTEGPEVVPAKATR